ncbi:MAG: zinc-dependent metalloprotease [Elusimicrobia bacterium]|nr:zinc-dependent metalloprotease [Elusimicrobiota bacterium]
MAAGQDVAPIGSALRDLQQSLSPSATPEELFAITKQGNDFHLTLRQNQLERLYLLSATLEQGTGERGLFSNMLFDPYLFLFHWTGENVQFVRKNALFRADPGSPESRALEKSFSDSILLSLPLISSDPAKGTFTLSARALFMTDLVNILGPLKSIVYSDASISLPDSRLEKISSFPKNMEVQVRLSFSRSAQTESSILPDPRHFSIVFHYSLTEVSSDSTFEPRPADGRVGHFIESYRDFSSGELKNQPDPAVYLIKRWNLRKKEPEAPASDVEKPVVFWLEDTIPEAYRPAIRAGILAWNAAFEAIGLRNAIVVKDVDQDMTPEERSRFDPADASYNMVRWFMGEGANFAQGLQRSNPMTGQIFNIGIRIGDLTARFQSTRPEWEIGSGSDPKAHRDGAGGDLEGLAAQAAAGFAFLCSRSDVSPSEKTRFLGEFLTWLLAHETGHALGLRHNFKASAALSPDDFGKEGLFSTSVMDYLPAYIAPKGSSQGRYFQMRLGPYDYWAIEYAYKPLAGDAQSKYSQLEAIAARSSSDPQLAYASDEDVTPGLGPGMDPGAQQFDLGPDPLEYARSQTLQARELWKNLEDGPFPSRPGLFLLRRLYMIGFERYRDAARIAIPLIGGVRARRGWPGKHDSYEPVPASQQRRALRFLGEEIFSSEPFQVSPHLVRRMGQEKVRDLEPNWPVSVSAQVGNLQFGVLRELYGRNLYLLSDRSQLVEKPTDSLSLGEVMETIRRSIWKEIESRKNRSVHLFRRNLQRQHLKLLTELLENENANGDARAMARRDLVAISRNVYRALRSDRLDAEMRAYLEQVRPELRRTLSSKP